MRAYLPPNNPPATQNVIPVSRVSILANQIAKRDAAVADADMPEIEDAGPTPNIFSVATEWVDLRKKDSELASREDELIAEAAKTKKEIQKNFLADWTKSNRIIPIENTTPQRPNAAIEGARKLLGKLAPTAPEKVNSPPPTPALILRMHEIGVELDAIHEARKLLAPLIRKAFLDGSVRLRELIKPQFDKLQRDVFSALLALGNSMLAYDEFMTRHRNMALSLFRPVIGPIQSRAVLSIGDPRDRSSPLRRFLQQAVDSGHLKERDLPREWIATFDPHKVKQWHDPIG